MCVFDPTDLCNVAHLPGVCILWDRCICKNLAGWHTATHTCPPPGTHLCLCVNVTRSERLFIKGENHLDIFSYLHTLPSGFLLLLYSQVLLLVASCTQVDIQECSCACLWLRCVHMCRSSGMILVCCGTAPCKAHAPHCQHTHFYL